MVLFDIYNNNRRTRDDIILDILSASIEGVSKTKIVYGVNLNCKQATEYIDYLIGSDLLMEEYHGNKKILKTTTKGVDLLRRMRDLIV